MIMSPTYRTGTVARVPGIDTRRDTRRTPVLVGTSPDNSFLCPSTPDTCPTLDSRFRHSLVTFGNQVGGAHGRAARCAARSSASRRTIRSVELISRGERACMFTLGIRPHFICRSDARIVLDAAGRHTWGARGLQVRQKRR
jgi:hypothetical protein